MSREGLTATGVAVLAIAVALAAWTALVEPLGGCGTPLPIRVALFGSHGSACTHAARLQVGVGLGFSAALLAVAVVLLVRGSSR